MATRVRRNNFTTKDAEHTLTRRIEGGAVWSGAVQLVSAWVHARTHAHTQCALASCCQVLWQRAEAKETGVFWKVPVIGELIEVEVQVRGAKTPRV